MYMYVAVVFIIIIIRFMYYSTWDESTCAQAAGDDNFELCVPGTCAAPLRCAPLPECDCRCMAASLLDAVGRALQIV
jgi:hypothetical protein